MTFEENWPRGYRGEVVERCGRTDDGRTDDGRQVITIAHSEPCSGELNGAPLVFAITVTTKKNARASLDRFSLDLIILGNASLDF